MNRSNASQFLPLVQALADGKTIQVLIGNKWQDLCLHEFPWSREPGDYRIKPEKKTGWINIYRSSIYKSVAIGNWIYDTQSDATCAALKERIACIQITYEEGEGL